MLLLLVGAVVCLCACACSLLLDWSEADQMCAADTTCEPGYSCLGERCIRDRSLAPGETCIHDFHCRPDLVCGRDPATCRVPCESYYAEVSAECKEREYCKVVIDRSDGGRRIVGMCQGSDACDPAGSCAVAEQECVPLRAGVSACAIACEQATSGVPYSSNVCW